MSIASTLSPATVLISTLFNAAVWPKRPHMSSSTAAVFHHLLENPSAIVLVEGSSGSGKSTLLNHIVKLARARECPLVRTVRTDIQTRSRVIDHLISIVEQRKPDASNVVNEVSAILATCGVGEPALWLRRPKCLSDSEQARFMLACAIARADTSCSSRPFIVVIDEFLSTLDRITAQATCAAIARLVKLRPALRLLVATAHCDLAAYLEPLFVVRPTKGGNS